MSHNVHEGRIAVEAARKYNRIVQHGTQSRSEPRLGQRDRRASSRASYGKLLVSQGYCYKPRWSIGHKPIASAAGGTRLQPLARAGAPSSRTTATSSTTTGTGSGISATATSATRASTRWTSPAGPSRAPRCRPRSGASAAASATSDQGQTPNTQIAVMDFGDTQLIFEVRGLVDKPKDKDFPFKFKVRQRVLHDRGPDRRTASSTRKGERRSPSRWRSSTSRSTPGGRRGAASSHAVRSRKPEDLNADVRARPLLQRPLPPGQHLLPPRRASPVQQQGEDAGRQPRSRRDLDESAGEPQGRRGPPRRNHVSTGPHTDRRSHERTFRRRRCGGREPSAQPAVSCRRSSCRKPCSRSRAHVGSLEHQARAECRRSPGRLSLAARVCKQRACVGGRATAPAVAPHRRSRSRRVSSRSSISDGSKATVKLLDVEATRDTLRSAIREARVRLEIDGQPTTLLAAMYHLPWTIAGCRSTVRSPTASIR